MSTSADVAVLVTDNGDGSADFTVSFAEDDYRFSASPDNGVAVVAYEETLSWRGQIRVSEPEEVMFHELMISDEMAEYLDANGLESVRRERH